MMERNCSPSSFLVIFSFLILSQLGCGESTEKLSPANTSCSPNVANIEVQNGFLRILCGCQEAEGSIATNANTLTCTVAPDSLIVFNYAGTFQHRIVSSGTPSFPSGPIFDPLAEKTTRVHSIQLSASGTYSFVDAFDPAISGQVIVR
jgi:hypothetical protein